MKPVLLRLFIVLMGLLSGWPSPTLARPLPPVPDSLRVAYQAVPRPNAARLAVLLRIAYAYIEPLDSAGVLDYGAAAERLARRLGDSVGVGRAVDVRGHYYQQVSNQTQAQPLLERAEPLLAAAPPQVRGTSCYHLGWLYDELGQAPRALRYYRRAYALAGQARDAGLQASVLNSWSSVYMYRQQYDSAQYFMLRSLRLAHQLGERAAEATSLGNLASILKMAGRPRAALPYARQAAGLQRALGDSVALAATYNTLGDLTNALGLLAPARHYFRAALALGRRYRIEGALSMSYIGLAEVYTKTGALDSAEVYHLTAIRQAERSRNFINLPGLMASLVDLYVRQPGRLAAAADWAARLQALPTTEGKKPLLALEALAAVAEARHDYARALGLRKQLEALKTKALARNNEAMAQELRVRYDTERAEQQVVVAQQARELESLRRQRQVGALLALAAGLLALLAGVVWWYRRRQHRRETALRGRLAADLHDDLGPLLTQLAVETSLLRENTHTPAQLLARLQRLTDTSQQATQHLGEVLRDLDQGPAAAAPAPLGELVAQLREQAHEALAPHELGLTFRLADPALAAQLVEPAARHALALIFREALHNVVKHAAGATLVQASMARAQSGLLLTLHDDGQPTGAPTARPGGRGLRNMGTRAEALGGWCEAGPAPGGSYQVRAWLPA